jgi:hypothetical protein
VKAYPDYVENQRNACGHGPHAIKERKWMRQNACSGGSCETLRWDHKFRSLHRDQRRRIACLDMPAIAVAAFAEPDPVNAMIEAHSAARQAWNDAVKIESRLYRQDPRLEAAELETSRLSDIKSSRFHDLAAASPTTVEGVADLLEYICGVHATDDAEFCEDALVVVMGNAAIMLRELVAR